MKKLANKITKKKIDGRKVKPGNITGKGGFVKGQSGNPSGRPKDSPEIKLLRESTREHLLSAVGWAENLTYEDIKKIDRKKLTLLQGGILKAFEKYKQTANAEWIRYPMDHMIGRPKESLELDGKGGNITLVVSNDYMPAIPADDNLKSK